MELQGMERMVIPVNPSVIMRHPEKLLGFAAEMRGIFREPELEGLEVKISSGSVKTETVSLMSLLHVIVRGVGELTIWVTEEFAEMLQPRLYKLFGIK